MPSLEWCPASSVEVVAIADVEEIKVSDGKATRDVCIVVDWDDTLLCTHHLNTLGLRLSSTENEVRSLAGSDLESLSSVVVEFLSMLLERAPVTILTNADQGWVEASCRTFLPDVLPMLDKVTVRSARARFEASAPLASNPMAPIEWKTRAMHVELADKWSEPEVPELHSRHLLSFGDSEAEREAALRVGDYHDTFDKTVKHDCPLYVKVWKLMQYPNVHQLRAQLECIIEGFSGYYADDRNCDLQLDDHAMFEPMTDGNEPLHEEEVKLGSNGTESRALYC